MLTRIKINHSGAAIASAALIFGLVLSACEPADREPVDADSYEVRGQVIEIRYDGEAVLIDHEEIPDYMTAMRMEFRVRDTEDLTDVQPGDSVRFRYVVESPTESYIDDVEVLSRHELPADTLEYDAEQLDEPALGDGDAAEGAEE